MGWWRCEAANGSRERHRPPPKPLPHSSVSAVPPFSFRRWRALWPCLEHGGRHSPIQGNLPEVCSQKNRAAAPGAVCDIWYPYYHQLTAVSGHTSTDSPKRRLIHHCLSFPVFPFACRRGGLFHKEY